MTISNFKYQVAKSFENALALMQEDENSALMFGDQALTGMLKHAYHPSRLISMAGVAGSRLLYSDGQFINAGPLVTYHQLAHIAEIATLKALSGALASIADPHLLNNSTIAGALYYTGNSSGSIAAALAVLGAEMDVLNSFGESTITVYDWLSAERLTEAEPEIILKSVRIPLNTNLSGAYQNHRYIKSGLMSYGAAVSVNRTGLDVNELKIVLSGFEARPIVLADTSNILMLGTVHTETLAEKIAAAISSQPVVNKGIAPDTSYLTHLYTIITQKAIYALIET